MPVKTIEQNGKTPKIVHPSGRSKTFSNFILPLLPSEKKKEIDEYKVLAELIKTILTGDEVSIKDNYASLVTYLILNRKDISYDQFVGAYEAMDCTDSKHSVCSALPYCALITSGIILKWPAEQQNQVASKLLKIHQIDPESKNIVFHFLLALDNSVKLSTRKLSKMSVNSPIQLYFLLSVDSKRDDFSSESSVFDAENMLNMVDIYLEESEDSDMSKMISPLLGRKLLSLPEDALFKFWEKILDSYSKPRTDYKELAVLHLLASILENMESDVKIEKLFTSSVINILSKSSPKIEPCFKVINQCLKNISPNLSDLIKLELIDAVLINCNKYLERSPVVKICDTLIGSLSFEGITHVAALYKQVIMGEKHKSSNKQSKIHNDFSDFEKIYCVRVLAKLMSHASCKYQTKWRKDQLMFLFEIGFLTEHNNVISSHVAALSRKIFYSCLNQKFANLSDLDKILKKLVKFAGEKMNKKEENFVTPFKENAYNLWFQTITVIKSLKDTNDEDVIVFTVLLRYMMLFMFSNYQVSKHTLEELFKVIENKKLSDNEMHWTEVTIDLFLHLLSGNDNAHKNVIHCTFSHVCQHMTLKGLNLILNAIKGKDDDMSVDSGDESDSDDNDFDDTGSDENEDDSSQESVENEGQNDKLKDALRQELYKIDTASTCGSVDIDDLEEDEGKHLNSTLGEIFKEQHMRFKSAVKNKVDNVELHFRVRAINLLEMYVENNPSLYSSTVVLTTLISLLKISIPNHTLEPFTVSLKRCLKKLNNIKEFSNCDNVTETSLCSVLNQILYKDCSINVYNDMSEQLVDSCLFIVRASSQLKDTSGEILECLKGYLKTYFEKDYHIPFLLFTTIYSTFTLDKLIKITLDIVTFAFSDEIKNHKKSQALQLLMTFYNNSRLFKNVEGFESSLIKIEENFLKKSLKAFSRMTDDSEINKKFCCLYLDVLSLMKLKKITSVPGTHWDKLPEIIRKLSEVPVFNKELKVSFDKFCKIFSAPQSENDIKLNESTSKNKVKRKSSFNSSETSPLKSPKKKKLKGKFEQKKLR